jgi:hypothetical protein
MASRKVFFNSSGGHLVTLTINHADQNLATEYDWIPILKQQVKLCAVISNLTQGMRGNEWGSTSNKIGQE